VKHPPSAASPGCPNGGPSPARRRQAQARARRQQSCAWHQSARTSLLPQVRAQAHRARKRGHRPEPERAPEDRCPRAIPAPAVKPCRAPFPASVSGPLVTLHRYRSPGREGTAARGEDLVSPAGCRARHPPAPRPRAPGRPGPTPAAWPAAPAASTPIDGTARAVAPPRQPRAFSNRRSIDGHQPYWPAPAQQPAHPADSHRPGSQRAPICTARAQRPSAIVGPADRHQPSNQCTSGNQRAPPTRSSVGNRHARRPAPTHRTATSPPAAHTAPPTATAQQPARQQPTPPHRRARPTAASGLLSRTRRRAAPGGLLVPPSAWPTRVIPSVGHRRSV
jgi:hypothetical protein